MFFVFVFVKEPFSAPKKENLISIMYHINDDRHVCDTLRRSLLEKEKRAFLQRNHPFHNFMYLV